MMMIRRDSKLMSMFRSTASRANFVQVLSIAENGNLNAISRYEREAQEFFQKHSYTFCSHSSRASTRLFVTSNARCEKNFFEMLEI